MILNSQHNLSPRSSRHIILCSQRAPWVSTCKSVVAHCYNATLEILVVLLVLREMRIVFELVFNDCDLPRASLHTGHTRRSFGERPETVPLKQTIAVTIYL